VLPIELLSFGEACYYTFVGELTFEVHPGALRWEGDAAADVWLPCTDGGRVVHLARCDLAGIDVEPGLPWTGLACGETSIPLGRSTTWVDPGDQGCELVAIDTAGNPLWVDRAEPGERWTCRPMLAGGGCLLRGPHDSAVDWNHRLGRLAAGGCRRGGTYCRNDRVLAVGDQDQSEGTKSMTERPPKSSISTRTANVSGVGHFDNAKSRVRSAAIATPSTCSGTVTAPPDTSAWEASHCDQLSPVRPAHREATAVRGPRPGHRGEGVAGVLDGGPTGLVRHRQPGCDPPIHQDRDRGQDGAARVTRRTAR
jgi:hypothetical protein